MLLFGFGILLGIAVLMMLGLGIFAEEIRVECLSCAGIGAFICAGVIAVSCFNYVPTGYTGIVTTFGRVEDFTLDAGATWLKPWQKVVKMDNRTQKITLDLNCFSSDIQEVSVKYTVNYQINKETASHIYRNIGTEYFDIIVKPKVLEAVKSVFAQYNAENLIASRATLSNEVEGLLKGDLADYSIDIISTSIEDIDFTDAFTNAVEQKQVAEQNKLRAKTEQEQATLEEQAAAERKKISAQADADAAIIAAKADAEIAAISADSAEYQGQKDAAIMSNIGKQLNDCPDLIDYYKIQAWDGRLPSTMLGDSEALIGLGN